MKKLTNGLAQASLSEILKLMTVLCIMISPKYWSSMLDRLLHLWYCLSLSSRTFTYIHAYIHLYACTKEMLQWAQRFPFQWYNMWIGREDLSGLWPLLHRLEEYSQEWSSCCGKLWTHFQFYSGKLLLNLYKASFSEAWNILVTIRLIPYSGSYYGICSRQVSEPNLSNLSILSKKDPRSVQLRLHLGRIQRPYLID